MNYIISTALPRSGTALLTSILNNSEQVMMAVGPNIEIYRYQRNELIKKYGSKILKEKIDFFSPIQDCFGTTYKEELLNLILNSNLNLKFSLKNWKSFLIRSSNRVDHDSSDLTKNFYLLKGRKFKDILKNLFYIIKITRKAEKRQIIGFNESWNICSLPSIAKSFPEAKFVILIRDPRAIYAALEKNAVKRKELRVQLLSFARHFRKYVILANLFLNKKEFKKKLMIIKYEDLILKTEKKTKKICKFLNIHYDKSMLDVKNLKDYGKNKKFVATSAFGLRFNSFDKRPLKNWEKYLHPLDVKTIEYLCTKELESVGYKLKYKTSNNNKKIFQNLKKDYQKKV
ncbi:sulfotransferase, partial [Candidatus Pelagibacter sp.]|nr:sulfotransferase [Candidatus Pelagibacter sp.]